MVKVFISYRRDDSADTTDSIYLQLQSTFGEDNVFLDVGSIPFGVDFRKYLNDQIQAHDVVLVIIGREWAEIMKKRASQPNDFVRIEIEYALQHNKLVIPVLVRGATMPDFNSLPESISELQWRNSAKVRRLPDFINDCQRLTDGILQWASVTDTETTNIPQSESSLEKSIALANTFKGKRNRDWTPVIMKLGDILPDSPLLDVEMCLVPVGEFIMGHNDIIENAVKNSHIPAHRQRITKPYWIGRYPVTNAQWRKGVEAGAVPAPSDRDYITLETFLDPKMKDFPVTTINALESWQFSQWAGCTLPSELEWEYAARGVESWLYPWGNTFNADYLVFEDTPQYGGLENGPAPVASFPEGSSWVGAQHLVGNISEWTRSEIKPYPYQADDTNDEVVLKRDGEFVKYVNRGGHYSSNDPEWLQCHYRSVHRVRNYFGLRLAVIQY